MPDAAGARALEALVARLATMTGTRHFGSAYPNPVTVEPDFKTILAVRRFPHVCVWLDATEDRVPAQSVGSEQGFITPHVFGLLGYVERTPSVTPMTWAIRLVEDIELTLAASFTLGGIAHRLTIGPADFNFELNVTDGIPKIGTCELSVTAHIPQLLTVSP